MGRRGAAFLYSLLRIAAFPLVAGYFLGRGLSNPRYFRQFKERLGFLPESFKALPPGGVWLHAVSVGEVVSAVQVIQELRSAAPQVPLVLSTTTLAGRAVADQKAAGLADGIFFAPIDYHFVLRRVMRRLRPSVVAVLETEIWPVMYREAKRSGSGLMVLNGRISDRAFPRYHRVRWFFRSVLDLPDRIFVQSEPDRTRYVALGAIPERVQMIGNLKYDAAPNSTPPPEFLLRFLAQVRPEAIWVAASTMPSAGAGDPDEDDAVIAAFNELARSHPGLLLILVPRKPERFESAAAKLTRAGVSFIRRSTNCLELRLPGVLLLDSIGELASVFPLCDVVFMGGTLARRGGHNVLEPALAARAIIAGPHMGNFAAIAAAFREQQAWVEISRPAELGCAVAALLRDPARRGQLGSRARRLALENQGASSRAAAEILKLRDQAIPVYRRGGPAWPLFWLLSLAWRLGSRWKQMRDTAHACALSKPVISVGGLAMGGTAKTPLVQFLARQLRNRGYRPAVLTRGYRRHAGGPLVIPAGEPAPVEVTGDEAQILLKAGDADVGIGADRYGVGCQMEEQFFPSLFLLDDGFQHWRLRRDMDIVLIDGLDPFGGGVFPLGKLREPVSALARASAVVITRAEPGRNYEAIRRILQTVNPTAPVFQASLRTHGWIRHGSPERAESAVPRLPAAAFCGLGNPGSFLQTLRALGINPVFFQSFPDHRRYTARELQQLAARARRLGARALLTTQKDVVNAQAAIKLDLEVYWLRIDIELQHLDTFLRFIEEKTALTQYRDVQPAT